MISNKAVGSMTLVIIAVAGMRMHAAEQTASELYGQGVHAYFGGDYDTAIASLSASIKKNSGDPRAYFFRGLALASQNGLDAGLPDLAKGADLEVNRVDDRLYDVNGALQRVQGALRMAVEKQRKAARLAAAEKKKKQDQVKYEQLKRREDIVLYQPGQPATKIDFQLPAVELKDGDPFASGLAFTGGKEVESATPAPVEPSAAAMASPAESAEQRDPFADPTAKPADPFDDAAPPKKAIQAEKEPDPSNPFGDNMAEVAPDDPIFDENVRPELPPSMNVGGAIIDMLGKTLSGASSEAKDRDPFGEDDPAAPAKTEPAAVDTGAATKKPDPNENPFK